MAARKHQPKPRGASRTSAAPARKPVPGWIWLVAGAAIGGFFVFLAQLKPGSEEVKRAPAGKPEAVAAGKPAQPAAPPKPKYDFYTLLSQSPNASGALQAPVPSPTAEQVRAAEAARAQALLEGRTPPPRLVMAQPAAPNATTPAAPAQAQAAAATPAPAPPPAPAPAPPAQPAQAPSATKTAKAPVAKTAAATPPPKPSSAPASTPAATPAPPPAAAPNARYYLQAGSFASPEQAESARARLLLLGQDARVESSKVGDKTWHRVVVGPFGSRPQADAAQKSLGASGVSSVVQQRPGR